MMRRPREIINYGPSALLLRWEPRIDPDINAGVHAYAAALEEHPDVIDCVPGFASLLLYFKVGHISGYQLREWIYDRVIPPPEQRIGRRHRLPVVYGGDFGPDMAEVSALTGLSVKKIIKLHTAGVYRVYQLGFRPGFAFLGLTDEKLAVDRRANPRSRVPAGSVGLAGRQTGIYPHASPGGWQLIGRCPEPLWETDTALLAAGDEVEFYAIPEKKWGSSSTASTKRKPKRAAKKVKTIRPAPQDDSPQPATVGRLRLECIEPGIGAFLVDDGRPGQRKFGIASGGAADRRVMWRLREILELPAGSPLVEFTLSGGQWLLSGRGQIALGGADIPWRLNGRPVETYTTIDLDGDYLLDGGRASCGCRAYLAIRGEWGLPRVGGSVSPGLPDVPTPQAGWFAEIDCWEELGYSSDLEPYQHCPELPLQLAVMPGPEWELLPESDRSKLLSMTFRVGSESDRQGIRIASERSSDGDGSDFFSPVISDDEAGAAGLTNQLLSSPVLPGTLQWSPAGGLLLLHDAQTVGGFPRLLQLASDEDVDQCGQLRPGDTLRFVMI